MITSPDQQDTQAGIVPNQTGTIPTQAEIEALSRELTEQFICGGTETEYEHLTDLHYRAALMIARLEIIAIQHNGD